MKYLIMLLAFVSSSVIAQQPITHTYMVTGRVISVDSPITQTVQRGQVCERQEQLQRYNPQQTDLNAGSIVGAVVGGVLGAQVGKGTGRDAAIGVGAASGALIGSNRSRQPEYNLQPSSPRCSSSFEEVVVGYNFTAQYEHYQIHGQMRQMPRVGMPVDITVRSTLIIENRGF